MKRHVITLAAILFLAACNEGSTSYDTGEIAEYTEHEVPTTNKSVSPNTSIAEIHQNQKRIKTGFLTFEVSNLNATHSFLLAELSKHKGYVAHDEESKGYNRIVHNLVLRIPAQSFNPFLESIANEVTHFDEKNIEVRDVTEQFVDLEARLHAKKELEKRYLALLQKASAVEDILRVERELNTVRTEIESMEGRMRVLKDQISYSTLTIEYYTTEAIQAQGFSSKIGHQFLKGWDGALHFLLGMVRIWPFLLVTAAVGFFIRLRWKRRRSKA